MAKFKVGDKVRVIDFKENPPHWSRSGKMDRWKGKTVTLEKITRTNVTSDMEFSLREDRGEVLGQKWVWKSSDFEPVETRREFIVIHRSGNVMTAEHRVNREVIKSAKATCAPSDTFDFDTGAKLAFDRLIGRQNIDEAIKAWNEPSPAPEPPKYYTGKVVCVENKRFPEKVGLIANIIDGVCSHGNWKRMTLVPFESFESFCKTNSNAKFIEVYE